MAPVRVDFQTRRDRLLDSIDKLQRLRDSMDSEEFAKDWRNVDAASNRLIAIGECMAPGTPHATPGTARIFHDARNRLAHEYFEVTASQVWDLLEQVDYLQEEVEARRDVPNVQGTQRTRQHDRRGRNL